MHDILAMNIHTTLDEKTLKIIHELTMQVSSPNYSKTPLFKTEPASTTASTATSSGAKYRDNKKRPLFHHHNNVPPAYKAGEKQTDAKTAAETHLVKIRLLLNKLTDKNFLDIRNAILPILDEVPNQEEIGALIFDIASKNRFYSKIYAELYSECVLKYTSMHEILERKFNQFTELFNNIQYVDSAADYDAFCENNKLNEKRKSLSMFYFHLMTNGSVSKEKFVQVTLHLLSKVVEYMDQEDKKNVVDELIETIILVYDKTGALYEGSHATLDGKSIPQVIEWISTCKVKEHAGLSSKTIFKLMDLLGR